MKNIAKQKPQDEQSINILKRVAKRVEEATVDIHSIKYDIKAMKLDIGFMQSDFAIMKVDVEKTREELNDKLAGLEIRLNKRITNVADLITISLGKKLQKVGKRVAKVEKIQHFQQSS